MNVTFTSLEALVLKATNELLSNPDSAAVEAFYSIMRASPEGPQLAARVLASRVHSRNAKEALLALEMLELCLRRGDPKFLSEVGKFRFLNELIMLVSPKYFAERTAPEVKTRIIQLFYAWSNQHQSKFKVAYDMLKNQGVIKEPPLPMPSQAEYKSKSKRSAIFEDKEKSKILQKLLQSKKPEDLQHANKLIKNMVREEERKNEADSCCIQEVLAALDSAELLQEMLRQVQNPTSDEEQLIQEVHANCTRLVPKLLQLGSANIDNDILGTILHASDTIFEALKKHKNYMQMRQSQAYTQTTTSRASSNTAADHSLLDFAGASARAQGDSAIDNDKTINQSSMEDLGDIFSSVNSCETPSATDSVMNTNVVMPVTILEADEVIISEDSSLAERGWGELDSLSEQMLKQSLPCSTKRNDGFTSKSTKKIPMNRLDKPTNNKSECDSIAATSNTLLDLDFFTKKYDEDKSLTQPCCYTAADNTDDLILDISNEQESKEKLAVIAPSVNSLATTNALPSNLKSPLDKQNFSEMLKEMKADEVKTLNDIHISISDVRPSRLSPVRAFEEEGGLAVILHFCRDRPRLDVNVFVVSTTSKKTSPIEDYKFQVFVPKGCKVRLLEQSKSSLPAYTPFMPPPALTQLMLLARPPSLPTLCLKFVITYSSDGETHSEIGEVKQLPLDCL